MDTYLQDRLAIADLMIGWMHRDLAEWDQLRALFHADGVIEITWFEGIASDFVDGSMRMGASDIGTKHLVAAPVVTFHGSKAIAETNAMVIAENAKLRVGCSAHCRFYDEVEKRAGACFPPNRRVVSQVSSGPKTLEQVRCAKSSRAPGEAKRSGPSVRRGGNAGGDDAVRRWRLPCLEGEGNARR